MKRTNWRPIQTQAKQAAADLGHEIGPFAKPGKRTRSVRIASCEKCGGCCWTAKTGDGLRAGGLILKYRCGTKEAAGVL